MHLLPSDVVIDSINEYPDTDLGCASANPVIKFYSMLIYFGGTLGYCFPAEEANIRGLLASHSTTETDIELKTAENVQSPPVSS